VYDTINDPSSAVVNILGMLVGVGAITRTTRNGPGIASAANLRRGMTSDNVASLGTIFKAQDDKLQSIMKVCKA